MFDFIRKPLVWDAWRQGLGSEIESGAFELKAMQDLAVYSYLRGITGAKIAEIGAGHSRVLATLAARNQCVTVERFEGQGGGPTVAQDVRGVANVPAFLGENDSRLEAGSFDAVYSISVVEHVPTVEQLTAFHSDQLRILKPGGFFLHAIDLYLQDEPSQYQVERFGVYRSWVTDTPEVEPLGAVNHGPCEFSCDIATNPDNVLYAWGNVAPALDPMRQMSQSVSLLVGGRVANRSA